MNEIDSLEMAVIDRNAEYWGVEPWELMEEAGRKVASEIESNRSVTLFCGKGNNGGDGFVAARYLFEKECDVKVVLVGKERSIGTDVARDNWLKLKNLDVTLIEGPRKEFYNDLEITSDVVVDAILGVGIKGRLREPVKSAVQAINRAKKSRIVSVDVPTGIDPDTGKGYGVKSDTTITFHKKKKGLNKAKLVDIGIPDKAETHVGPGDLFFLPKRKENSHKGENGRLMVIGGEEYTGAPALSALAALRSGCDLPVIYTKGNKDTISGFSPNLIVRDIKSFDSDKIYKSSSKFDAALIGPGLGRNSESMEEIRRLIDKLDIKKVLDADALHACKKTKTLLRKSIITPHSGEFESLFGKKPSKQLIKEFADQYNCIILKKGKNDIISNGDTIKINESGNAGMTVGGTGDILAGVVSSLVARKDYDFRLTAAASFIVGKAGDQIKKDLGVDGIIATDLLKEIPKVRAEQV
ncbi:MAG: NAD(P)H-hydrate repair enzyme Nnr NAD(P)H-hydrate dehydratase domain [Candidatus Methanohalarchaeum thermophilum]|uniref:Bifunctional NAD(P)H-hydrate repair enzyme n=1 Tax=Methanohalarchaeum thermophilum TaxID=1903181 RepID=A0A1Q6DU10_METT1|nr:MAG: NAD(P)H-hydrate repair enzyme Nnr NAD(P)H-hydrate dehydratase domain [Candidatus Methanohalarchaeum thermophilum]